MKSLVISNDVKKKCDEVNKKNKIRELQKLYEICLLDTRN